MGRRSRQAIAGLLFAAGLASCTGAGGRDTTAATSMARARRSSIPTSVSTSVAPLRSGTAGGTTTMTSPPLTLPATAGLAPVGLAPVRGQIIAIDPGHNGANWTDPAAINQQVFVGNGYKACDTTGTETDSGYTEAAFTFDVATRLAALLQAAGAEVVMTRDNNTGVGPCVNQRAAIANQAHAAVALSIHGDGGPPGGRGFQVLEPAPIAGYNTAIVVPSDRLALDVRRDYQATTGEPFSTYYGADALAQRSDLGGLNLSTVPKVFIECANMRNAGDAALVQSPDFRQKIAQGLAQALADYLSGR